MNDKFWIILISIVLIIAFAIDYKLDKVNSRQEDLLTTIKNRGHIIVGVKTDTKPFGYIDKGKNVGFDIDLAKCITKDILHDENKVVFVPVTTANRLLKLNSGKVDIIIATMTATNKRGNIIDFSRPYFVAGQAILVKSNTRINSLSDIENNNIGVLFGSTAEDNIRLLLPSANIIGFKTYNDAYKALKNNEIVAITSDDTILRHFALTDPTVKMLKKRYTKEYYAIGVRKDNESKILLKVINMNIDNMIKHDTFIHLNRKWKLN